MSETRVGRKRSERAREAILSATFEIAKSGGYASLTMDSLAAAAGVGKQTIYRWWRSRAAVVHEALSRRASLRVEAPNRGALRNDLRAFLASTFDAVPAAGTAELLRGMMAEAQLDPGSRTELRALIDERRAALRAVFARAQGRGEIAASADLELALDLAFGVLWYRLLVGHAKLDRAAARQLASAIMKIFVSS